MKNLDKIRDMLAEAQCERLTSSLVDADTRARHFKRGFDAAVKELEPNIKELVDALEFYASLDLEMMVIHDVSNENVCEPVPARASKALEKYKQKIGEK